MFPVIETEIESGIYHPLPYYGDQNDWRNKNRRYWTKKEIEKLNSEYGVDKKIQPIGNNLLIYHLEYKNVSKLLSTDKKEKNYLSVGRILKMGEFCFDLFQFPTGAYGTFGDYVSFDFRGAEIIKGTNNKLLFIEDTSIIHQVDSDVFE